MRLNDAEAEASHQRTSADDARTALAALTLEYNEVRAHLRAADEAKRIWGAALDGARAATLASEAERATLQSLLDGYRPYFDALRRDPRDVVLSCFRRHFRVNASTYQMAGLERAARHYDAVMRLIELHLLRNVVHGHLGRDVAHRTARKGA